MTAIDPADQLRRGNWYRLARGRSGLLVSEYEGVFKFRSTKGNYFNTYRDQVVFMETRETMTERLKRVGVFVPGSSEVRYITDALRFWDLARGYDGEPLFVEHTTTVTSAREAMAGQFCFVNRMRNLLVIWNGSQSFNVYRYLPMSKTGSVNVVSTMYAGIDCWTHGESDLEAGTVGSYIQEYFEDTDRQWHEECHKLPWLTGDEDRNENWDRVADMQQFRR